MNGATKTLALGAIVAANILGPALARGEEAPRPAPGWIADAKGCKTWNAEPRPNETVSWSGECVGGYANGPGFDQWYEDGALGPRYEGTKYKGKFVGYVEATWPTGMKDRFQASDDGKAFGWAQIQYANGDRWEGEIKDGKRSGLGRIVRANGSYYEGSFKDDQYNGLGALHYSTGTVWEGNFTMGRPSGYGTYTRPDGVRISGHFVDGKFAPDPGSPPLNVPAPSQSSQ